MQLTLGRVISIVIIFLLSACATFGPGFDEPDISVSVFRLLPSNGLPKFEIELEITNPNNIELKLDGISYSAGIEGHKVVSGVANNIPVIPAYGTGSVTLTGGVNLFGGFQLLTDLMQQRNNGINYQLQAKLDFGRFMPNMYVEREGVIIAPPK